MFILRNLPYTIFRFAPDTPQGGEGSQGAAGQGAASGQQGNQTQAAAAQGAAQASNSQPANQQSQGASEIPQGLAAMIAKNNNDALKVAEMLHGDNFQLREQNRQLKAQVEGAVVLREADKSAWEQYRALGTPADIAKKLRQGDLDRIAGKAGYNPQVFADLDNMAGGKLVYEVKTETVDGKAQERVYVKDGSDASATPQLIGDFMTAKYAAYLPALQPQKADGARGVSFPPMGTGSNSQPPTSKAVAQSTLDKKYARKKTGT